MYCGAVLSEENLDETARLQMELNEANDTIKLLKQLATEAEKIKTENCKIKNDIQILQTQLSAEKQKYKKSIDEKEQQCSALTVQLKSLSKQKKSSGWIWLFFLICVGLNIFLIYGYQKYERLEREKSNHSNEIDSTKSEAVESKEKYNDLNRKFNDLRETFPLKITRIELGNTTDNQTIIDDFGSALHSSKLRYLTPKIYFKNYLKESKTLHFTINYYNSYGQFKFDPSNGNRPTSKNYISTSDNNKILKGWGDNSIVTWDVGTWTIEIWYDGVCLGTKRFIIY
jgi:cell division protein FtsB